VRRVLAAPVLALALVACGELREDDAEEKVRATLLQATRVLYTVDCPSGVRRAKGVRFRCIVTAPSGTRSRVEVRIVDDGGNFAVERVPLDPRRAERELARQPAVRGLRDIRCPSGRPRRRGTAIACTARTAGGRRAVIEAVVADERGTVQAQRVATTG